MKYLLLGDETKVLFIEDDDMLISYMYNAKKGKWVSGGSILNDARRGYDPSEGAGSMFNSGDDSEILEISKKEAEAFIGKKINQEEVDKLLNLSII